MAPLRWGIASAGRISNDFCTALNTLPEKEHQIVAISAREESTAKEFASKFNIKKFYGGYEKLANDPEVDVVYIGAINTVHLELALMMLDGNKHVLCEKPLTMNEKQTKILLDHAKLKNLLCVEAIWSRFFPSYRYLKNRLDNNDLGEIKEVEIEFGFNLQSVDRLTKKDLGGGTILDLGVYCIQFVLLVYREMPISIKATGKLNEDGVDLATEVEMRFKNGGIARFKTSALEELSNKANIRGASNFMTLHNFWCPTYLTDIDQNIKEWKLPKPKFGKFEFMNSAGLRYEAEEMRRCIIDGKLDCSFITNEESLMISRVQDEVRRQIGCKFPEDG